MDDSQLGAQVVLGLIGIVLFLAGVGMASDKNKVGEFVVGTLLAIIGGVHMAPISMTLWALAIAG